ncbi:MAG: DUF2029 domain-containing protein [Candidatus Solibacter usitatus]|nr:DUF2029 domain-containing protein [Candidatus Solibacter usitatus]
MAGSPARRLSLALWAFTTLLISGLWIYWAQHYRQTAWDFTMFYVAAHAPIDSLHDQAVFQRTAREVLAGTAIDYASPYVRPAVFALPLHLLRGLPYWRAFTLWAAVQVLFLLAALAILAARFRVLVLGFYPWALFFPAAFGIITGQDAAALALILCAGLWLLEDRRDAPAGALLALTLYKFNLFLLIPVYLLMKRRYRALAAYCAAGAALALASAALEPPRVYLALLPHIERYTIGFSPHTMFGLRGLCAALGAGALYPLAALALAAATLYAARRLDFHLGFGAVVAAGILCAYHSAWYDATVLVLPLGLSLGGGGRLLRSLAILLLIAPLWNAAPALLTCGLLAFLALYLRPTAAP